VFLYLSATSSAATGATQLILFGSIFTVEPSTLPEVAILSVSCWPPLLHRPTALLSSLSVELAAARGVRVRVVGLLFMVTSPCPLDFPPSSLVQSLTALLIDLPRASEGRQSIWFGAPSPWYSIGAPGRHRLRVRQYYDSHIAGCP